jgi:hypothetical protein
VARHSAVVFRRAATGPLVLAASSLAPLVNLSSSL